MLKSGLHIASKLLDLGWVTLGLLLYFLVRGSVIDRQIQAEQNAELIINFEKAVGLFFEPQLNHWTASNEVVSHIFNSVYFWFHFPVIAVTGVILSIIARPAFVLLRNSMLLSGGVSLVVYWLFPVSPPRLVEGYDFVDTMVLFSHVSYQAQEFTPFVNQYAAMPSLHAGWALLLVLSVMSRFKSMTLRLFFAVIFLVQLVAIVCTANHFWLDGLIGIAICVLAWLGARLSHRMLYFE
jgi:hypothetical protein